MGENQENLTFLFPYWLRCHFKQFLQRNWVMWFLLSHGCVLEGQGNVRVFLCSGFTDWGKQKCDGYTFLYTGVCPWGQAWIESQNLGASFMHVIYKWHSFEEKFVIHDNHNFQTITFLWQVNVLCEPRESHWRIHHKLYCRKKSQRRCVLEQIDRVKGLVSADLQNLLGQPVDLTVDVSVSEKVGFETPMHTYWQISRCLLLS